MVEKNEFELLTDKIIAEMFKEEPYQQKIYDIEKDDVIGRLYADLPDTEYNGSIALEGGTTIKEVVDSLGVIVATFKLIKDVYTGVKSVIEKKEEKKKEVDIAMLRDEWKQKLMAQKVSEEKATAIANEFSAYLIKLL
jgi:hypothetical protein